MDKKIKGKVGHPKMTQEEYFLKYKNLKTNERRARVRTAKLKALLKLMWPAFKHIEDYEKLTGKKLKISEEEVKIKN